MQCPVCAMTEIHGETARCPSCGTDLTAVQRVGELGAVFFNEALALAQRGDCAAALDKVRAALAVDETSAARTVAGKLLWKLGRSHEAIHQWERAAAIDPEDDEPPRLLARARRHERRRKMRRWMAVGGVVAAVALLVAVAGYGSALVLGPAPAATAPEMEALSARLAGARGRVSELQAHLDRARADGKDLAEAFVAYRETHSHSDAELAAARTVAEEATRALERVETAAAEKLTRLDEALQARQSQWAEEQEARLRAERLAETLRERLAETGATAAQTAAALQEARQRLAVRDAWMRDTLGPLLVSMKPRRAAYLEAQIERYRSEIDALRRRQADLRKNPVWPITDLQLGRVQDRLKVADANLSLLERECAECLAPWQRAVQACHGVMATWQREETP